MCTEIYSNSSIISIDRTKCVRGGVRFEMSSYHIYLNITHRFKCASSARLARVKCESGKVRALRSRTEVSLDNSV